MTRFDDRTGHITEEVFAALAGDTLDELSRLDLAEHLSSCDLCCARYAQLTAQGPLEQPSRSLTEPTMTRIRGRGRVILLRRALKVSVAACLALTLWQTGAFSALTGLSNGDTASDWRLQIEQRRNLDAMQELNEQQTDEPAQTLNMKISSAVDHFFAAIQQKGETDQ